MPVFKRLTAFIGGDLEGERAREKKVARGLERTSCNMNYLYRPIREWDRVGINSVGLLRVADSMRKHTGQKNEKKRTNERENGGCRLIRVLRRK